MQGYWIANREGRLLTKDGRWLRWPVSNGDLRHMMHFRTIGAASEHCFLWDVDGRPVTLEEDRIMESWRKVFRDGVVPQLSTPGLEALEKALAEDSPQLIQGATTSPPPLACVSDWPVECACLISFCGWQGDGLTTVGDVEEFFARVCFQCDQVMGEPAAVRYCLNWFDETPREEMRQALLPEVRRALALRRDVAQEVGAA